MVRLFVFILRIYKVKNNLEQSQGSIYWKILPPPPGGWISAYDLLGKNMKRRKRKGGKM
jgi:hypothetical protein